MVSSPDRMESTATVARIIPITRLMTLDPDYDVRVSPKSSGKEAFCESGYLLLRPQNDKQVAGILVDSKNRAIACQPALSASGAEE